MKNIKSKNVYTFLSLLFPIRSGLEKGLKERSGQITKVALLLLFMVLSFSNDITAQKSSSLGAASTTNYYGLSKVEFGNVLQKCLDNPKLQMYYPTNEQGDFKQISIMQFPTAIPADINLSVAGKRIQFVEKSVKPDLDSYLMLRSISNNGETLNLNLNYFIKNEGREFVMKNVFVTFQKNNAGWTIKNFNLN